MCIDRFEGYFYFTIRTILRRFSSNRIRLRYNPFMLLVLRKNYWSRWISRNMRRTPVALLFIISIEGRMCRHLSVSVIYMLHLYPNLWHIETNFRGIHFRYKEKQMRRSEAKTPNWEYLYINTKSCNFYYMSRPHAIVQTIAFVY